MKVRRPPDQGVKDKGPPVCSKQHQTEPVAFFVPQNLSITMHILLSYFHPFPTTPSTPCPPPKRASLTFEPPVFIVLFIQNQPVGFLVFPGLILRYFLLVSCLSQLKD